MYIIQLSTNLEVAYVCYHVGQQRVAGYVEWHSQTLWE